MISYYQYQIKDLTTLAAYDTTIDPALNYTVLIFSIQTTGNESTSLMQKKQIEDRLMKSMLSSLTTYIANRFPHLHVFSRKNQLVMLLGTTPTLSTVKTHNEVSDTAERIRMYLEQSGKMDREIFCTIGSTLPILELSRSFEEAKKSSTYLRMTKKKRKFIFSMISILTLFWLIPFRRSKEKPFMRII
ncbi:hypothetical protein GQR36_20825 [Enterococcus termitis]